jgi:ankyrin repeat protein
MSKKSKDRRSLAEILCSTSDVLFPADLGEKSVELNSRGTEGDTPLHVMLWRNDSYAAELLIEAGADVDAVGDMGETPMHIAIQRENARLARALAQAGANMSIRSEFGETPDDLLRGASQEFRRLFARKSDH